MTRLNSFSFSSNNSRVGKADQRKFLDRRAVLFFRRAQNGEVDEGDRRIGLQQIAQRALARMRFAGDQQHAQLIAHAGRHHGGAVVEQRQFLRPGFGLDFDDVFAAVRQRQLERRAFAGLGRLVEHDLAVDANFQIGQRLGLPPKSSTRTVNFSGSPTMP